MYYFVAYIDLLLCVKDVMKEHEICFAEIKSGLKVEMEFRDMVHPLLQNPVPQSRRICNGLVITGFNMSGKTSFMLSLAVNQILATGLRIAFAKKFETGIMKVITFFRINDNLLEGRSRYYAETRRLCSMKESVSDNSCLCLVDEILSGTKFE